MSMKAGGDGELNAEINVTPLVDVMLVLLIIFMITAPLLNTDVSVDLPQVTAEEMDDPNGPLVLEIEKNDVIKLGKTYIHWADLEKLLKTNERIKTEGRLYIAANRELLYGHVITAMAVAKKAGVKQVLFLTRPNDTLDLSELDKNTGR